MGDGGNKNTDIFKFFQLCCDTVAVTLHIIMSYTRDETLYIRKAGFQYVCGPVAVHLKKNKLLSKKIFHRQRKLHDVWNMWPDNHLNF